ncbi:MAG: hypothetical protein AABY32_01650 [Nanoarchaeota archaeon]
MNRISVPDTNVNIESETIEAYSIVTNLGPDFVKKRLDETNETINEWQNKQKYHIKCIKINIIVGLIATGLAYLSYYWAQDIWITIAFFIFACPMSIYFIITDYYLYKILENGIKVQAEYKDKWLYYDRIINNYITKRN